MGLNPTYASQVRPSGALSLGLGGFYALNEGGGPIAFDATGNLNLTMTSIYGSTNPWMQSGPGIISIASGQLYAGTLPTPLRYSFPISLALGFRWLSAASGSNCMVFGCTQENTPSSYNEAWTFYRPSGSNDILLAWNNSSAEQVATIPGGPAVGVDAAVSVSYDLTAQYGYMNGVLKYTGSVAGNVNYLTNPQLTIGAFLPSTAYPAAGVLVRWGAWWFRELSSREHAAIGASPDAIFKLLYPRRRRFLIGGPPPPITLSVSGGVYALAGGAVNFKTATNLPATSGVYALAGGSATLSAVSGLPAAGAAYVLAGGSATLSAVSGLVTSQGSYTTSGGPVTTRTAIPAANGSYALLGGSITTGAASGLTASPGGFVLAGGSLTSRVDLAAIGVTYAIGGSDAIFGTGQILALAGGSFRLQGIATAWAGSGSIDADPGSFALGGGTIITQQPYLASFRLALFDHLSGLDELNAIVDGAIYPNALPATHDLQNDGPALLYAVQPFGRGFGHPVGHNLSGSDGTMMVRVTFTCAAYRYNDSDQMTTTLFHLLDGQHGIAWGDVGVPIQSCIHVNDTDHPIAPTTGRAWVIFEILSVYDIRFRVPLPESSFI